MRAPSVDKNGMKKGAWSEEEDNKLRAYILRYGHWNWRLLPKFAGLARCGKSCRLRWVNYLKPGVKRGDYSKEEEALILKLQDELGNKWSAIAEKLPGRTDNEIKNYWHAHLKKRRAKRIPSPNSSQTVCKNSPEASRTFQGSDIPILESSGSDLDSRCPVSWDSEDSASSSRSGPEFQASFLSELDPVLAETSKGRNGSSDSSFDGFEGSFWTKPFQVDTSYSQNVIFSPFEEGVFFSGNPFT